MECYYSEISRVSGGVVRIIGTICPTASPAAALRAQIWRRVLGSAEIPLRGPLPEPLPPEEIGGPIREVYQLDLGALSREQREAVIQYIAEIAGITLADAETGLEREGMPVLAEDLIVTTDSPWFL